MAFGNRLINTSAKVGLNFHYNPRTLSDGAVASWADSGDINIPLSLIQGSTSITKVTSGGIQYVNFPFSGSDSNVSVLRTGGSPLTTYTDYPTNVSLTFIQFVNISTGYNNILRYPTPMNIYNSDSSGIGEARYFLWRYGLTQQYQMQGRMIDSNANLFDSTIPTNSYAFPYGVWKMFGFTFDYNPLGVSTFKTYINGVLSDSDTNTGIWGVDSSSIILGHSNTAFYEARGGYLIGDTLGYFDGAKTDAEVLAIYNEYKGFYGL